MDYIGALEALLRLLKTYRLSINSLTAGVILDKASHSILAADDVYKLGELAMAWDHSLAVDWLNKSLQMEMQFPTGIPIAKIYANMAEMYEEASTVMMLAERLY